MANERYTLVRAYYDRSMGWAHLKTENIPCKTLTEAVELGSILTDEEKFMSFIEDRARHKKLTLKGDE